METTTVAAERKSTALGGRGEAQSGGPRRGAALLWLAVVLAVGVIAWLSLSAPSETPGETPNETPAEGRVTDEDPVQDPPAADLEDVGEGPRTVGTIEARPAGLDGGFARVFDGRGTIAGQVTTIDGSPPPRWTLHLEPSLVAPGRANAESRTVEAQPNEETFELRDVPMGAYRVYATAPGLRSSAQEVALYKLEGHEHLPGVNYVNVTVTLRPMASVDGTVRRANGNPADGLEVHLVPQKAAAPGERLTATTDLAGVYRFDAVPPGAWTVRVGDPVRPLTAPRPFTVAARGIELDEVQLPDLVTLEILVVDEAARPFPDVEVVGYVRGSGSGSLRGTTDPQGRLRVDYLNPGPWRVEATYEALGFAARRDWVLEVSDEIQEEEIVLR